MQRCPGGRRKERKDMLTTAGQGNRAAESYAEGKRRVPILSTASDMQTAPAGGYSVEAASGDRYAGEQDEGGRGVGAFLKQFIIGE